MGNYTPKLPPPTPDQITSLAELEARWGDEQLAEGADYDSRSVTVREAARLRWTQPRESLAQLIEGLEHGAYGRGRVALLKIASEIATTAKYDRDRLKAVELLLAYAEGRPVQSVAHVDVTPQWLEHQIRLRHPEYTDDQIARLVQRLATRVLPPE